MVNPKTNSSNEISNTAAGSSDPYPTPGTFKASLMDMPAIENLTEKESAHPSQQQLDRLTGSGPTAALFSTGSPPPDAKATNNFDNTHTSNQKSDHNLQGKCSEESFDSKPSPTAGAAKKGQFETKDSPCKLEVEQPEGCVNSEKQQETDKNENGKEATISTKEVRAAGSTVAPYDVDSWVPTQDWVKSWKSKLPLQTIMRLLQVLVPQVEKICIDKGLTDESEILRFLQHGTLVGLLPVPHPILIRKYQPNPGTAMWFRTYLWGVIYLRNTDPPIWYDTDVKLFEIQRV